MTLPRNVNRVLQLAAYDLDIKGKPTDAEIGQRWGVTDRAVRSLRETDEYREIIQHFQVLAITQIEDRVTRMQEEALTRLEDLVPLLADRALELLQPPAGHQQTDAANRAIRTLLELSSIRHGRASPAQEETSTQPLMPNLIIARSETTIVRDHLSSEAIEADFITIDESQE